MYTSRISHIIAMFVPAVSVPSLSLVSPSACSSHPHNFGSGRLASRPSLFSAFIMPSSIADGRTTSGMAASAPWRVDQHREVALANAPWRVHAAKREVVDWCHQPARRGRQAPKPKGDTSRWQQRTRENVKNIANVRRGLRHQLSLAISWVDAPGPGEEEQASINLEKQYRKMYFLDELNLIIEDAKDGRPEVHTVMSPEQVDRNNHLRATESAPAIKAWHVLRKGVERDRQTFEEAPQGAKRPRLMTGEAHDGRAPQRDAERPRLMTAEQPPAAAWPKDVPFPPPPASPWAEDSDYPSQPAPPAASAYRGVKVPLSSDDDSQSTSSRLPPTSSNAARSPSRDEITPETAAMVSGSQNEAGHPLQTMFRLYRWTRYGPGRDRTPTRPPKLSAQRLGHTRLMERPCHILYQAHEIHPADEVDWTLGGDREDELKKRKIRNALAEEILRSKRSVKFRSTGNSLYPLVQTDDVTMWEPIFDHAKLQVGDVVFCRVQKSNAYYGHMIHEIGYYGRRKYWAIGNMKNPPHINGWCYAEHIFGQLMEVSPVPPRSSRRLDQPYALE